MIILIVLCLKDPRRWQIMSLPEDQVHLGGVMLDMAHTI